MSLAALMVRDLTIKAAPLAADAYGDEIRDWDNATDTPAKGWLSQLSRSEVDVNRDGFVDEWILYLPAGTEIDAGDRVVEGDRTYEVDGPPNRAWTPRGEHHIECNLRRVQG